MSTANKAVLEQGYLHNHTQRKGIFAWILSTDHKRIGILYMVSILSFFCVAVLIGLDDHDLFIHYSGYSCGFWSFRDGIFIHFNRSKFYCNHSPDAGTWHEVVPDAAVCLDPLCHSLDSITCHSHPGGNPVFDDSGTGIRTWFV